MQQQQQQPSHIYIEHDDEGDSHLKRRGSARRSVNSHAEDNARAAYTYEDDDHDVLDDDNDDPHAALLRLAPPPALYMLPLAFPVEEYSIAGCDRLSDADRATVHRIMCEFSEGTLSQLGMDFKVWDWTKPEMYGLLLGMFVKNGLVPNSATLCGLLNFVIDMADGYLDNPYHSFLHAVDVTYMVYYSLVDLALAAELAFTTVDFVSLLIAALAHDVLHPGVNNLFHVNAKTDLALRYRNKSVLERQSCDHLSFLLQKHTFLTDLLYGELAGAGSDPATLIESIAIEAILNTDMCHHFGLLEKLSSTTEEVIGTPGASEEDLAADSDMSEEALVDHSSHTCSHDCAKDLIHAHPRHYHPSASEIELATDTVINTLANASIDDAPVQAPSPLQQHHLPCSPTRTMTPVQFLLSTAEMTHVTASPEGIVPGQLPAVECERGRDLPVITAASMQSIGTLDSYEGDPGPRRTSLPLSKHQRQQMINVILHAADISNAARPAEICRRWSDMVVEEFLSQGDQEKARSIPVSPNMDRESSNPVQMAFEFNTYVARPYFEILSELLPATKPFIENLIANRTRWEEMGASSAPKVEISPPKPANEADAAAAMTEPADAAAAAAAAAAGGAGGGGGGSGVGEMDVTPRGRRLSLAAGTIEIPQAFDIYVMNAARRYRNRYKTSRSLSSGRSRGILPISSLSSSMWTVGSSGGSMHGSGDSLHSSGGAPDFARNAKQFLRHSHDILSQSIDELSSPTAGSWAGAGGGGGGGGGAGAGSSGSAIGSGTTNLNGSVMGSGVGGSGSIGGGLGDAGGSRGGNNTNSTNSMHDGSGGGGGGGGGAGGALAATTLSLFGSKKWFPQRRCMSMDAQSSDHGGQIFQRWHNGLRPGNVGTPLPPLPSTAGGLNVASEMDELATLLPLPSTPNQSAAPPSGLQPPLTSAPTPQRDVEVEASAT
ncbi:hypothetical protein HDU87_008214 [Geranomyces variabilis]|uniref:Phosphodiesterase n=1 Tax=Geranomyces variabilis TaxID=109894 RepID=A0AAD5TEV3_9FUNG|nr:hypothetical protein HDU87_008214 [Geranomyces variabilis]